MRLLLLSLAGLLMSGEALKGFSSNAPISRPVFYILSSPGHLKPKRPPPPPPPPSYSVEDRKMLLPLYYSLYPDPPRPHKRTTMVTMNSPPRVFTASTDHGSSSFSVTEGPVAPGVPSPSIPVIPSTVSNQPQQQHGLSDFVPPFRTTSLHSDNNSTSMSEEEQVSSFPNQGFQPASFEDDKNARPVIPDEAFSGGDSGQHHKPQSAEGKKGIHSSNPVCNILPDPGTCRAAFPRYYYDPETGTCNCYLYGGCTEYGEGESPSSFFTLADCQSECHPPNKEEGPICKEIFDDDTDFVSYLVEPSKENAPTDHLNDEQFLASLV